MTPFGPAHLALLAAVPVVAAALAALVRARPGSGRPVRVALAAVLVVNEVAWYLFLWNVGWLDRNALPLHLCGVMVWVTAGALVWLRPLALELVWFWGLAGTTQALLTPDIGAPAASYPGVRFFVAHGGIVVAALFLAFAGLVRPRPGAWWRTLALLALFALGVGLVNVALGTNYMYLAAKPPVASALDLLGEWPWYVVAGLGIAAALFFLLDLPFRRSRAPAGAAPRA